MIDEDAYTWIGAIIGGIIGLLVAMMLPGYFDKDMTKWFNLIFFLAFW